MKENWHHKTLYAMLGMIFLMPSITFSHERPDTAFIRRMFSYSKTINKNTNGLKTNIYLKYRIHTDKRNFTLFCVPTMYEIAKGNREYFGETYSTISFNKINDYKELEYISTGTIPHNRKTFPTLLGYLTPSIYENTLFKNQILSPFEKSNHKYYKYNVTFLLNGKVKISYKPRVYSTQLVHGWALADYSTGRIITAEIDGEYDMVAFAVNLEMGKEGIMSLLPKKCDLHVQFKFLGNKIQSWLKCTLCDPILLPSNILDSHSRKTMTLLRPEPLTEHENNIYSNFDSINAVKDSTQRNKKSYTKKTSDIWNTLGENLVNRLGTDFGDNEKGSFQTSPIFNPLYMSYSQRKGLTYRFDVNINYDFNSNSNIALNIKTGLLLKLRQFFVDFPLKLGYNNRKHAFTQFTVGTGNRITNSSILDEIKQGKPDSINFDKMNLDYFKDFYMKLENNYDISDYLTINAGIVFHRRSAVDKSGFEKNNRPSVYKAFAPALRLVYRPFKWNGPVITADYEKCLDKLMGSDMSYERWEFNASMKKNFKRMCVLSVRFGGGFYTAKSDKTYFLDYTNFRENNLIGGWNDDWTGDFQLLNSNWYNASSYYVRNNITYERPLLIATWIPIIGHYIENERIYMNTLFVNHLNPYIEYGYGFTNSFFSLGAFVGTINGKYDGFGCRFTFELFSKW